MKDVDMCPAMVEHNRQRDVIAGVKVARPLFTDEATMYQHVAETFSETPEYVATTWKKYKEKNNTEEQ